MFKKLIGVLIVCSLMGLALLFANLSRSMNTPGPLLQDSLVYIAPGSSGSGIANKLKENKVIDNVFLFRIATRLEQKDGPLQAGEYMIPARATLYDVVHILQSGKTYAREVTIPEGLTSREILDILNKTEALTGGIDIVPPEGTLLPETYFYSYGDSRVAIIDRMHRSLTRTIDELWPKRAEGLPLKSPLEAIILASIVEKETGIAGERPRVAGVFINRLKIGMPLQSDPTVIYALTEGKKDLGRLLMRKDLEFPSPYNTYQNNGLPPAPIAHPGAASIAAVLQPEQHDFYYFVADGTGGHTFGRTYDDHLKNVSRWRQIQKSAQ